MTTSIWVEWIEPFGPNSEPVYLRCPASTAIAVQKSIVAQRNLHYNSDQDALDDFCTIHYANVVTTEDH